MKHLLSSTAFIVLNKDLARKVGLKSAVLLADLISKEEYFIANGMTEGWFFNTEANIEQDTTLTPFQQRKCLKTLENHLLVDTKRKGIPAKRYFKINQEQVMKFLNNLQSTKSTTINKNKKIKIINKYFLRPTVFDVKNYCNERGNNIDAEAFINFYDSKGWKVGNAAMKDWKAAVRTWETRDKNKPKGNSKVDNQISEWQKAKDLL
tara:strand:+ start:558 stop:1178 length:621 start_codon:yes stop_codon:yes gene_type:complete